MPQERKNMIYYYVSKQSAIFDNSNTSQFFKIYFPIWDFSHFLPMSGTIFHPPQKGAEI